VTAGNPPRGYQAIFASNPEGGCEPGGLIAEIYPRPILIEIAVIENVGRRPMEISGLLGKRYRGGSLRRSRRPSGRAQSLGISAGRLGPGQRAILVMRMTLMKNEQLRRIQEEQSEYLRHFREARLPNFDYGPAVSLAGFDADGEHFDLDGQSANFLGLTASVESGSCPFVHVWNEKLRAWVDHQKVLHHANTAERETTDVLKFDGLRTRFKIIEKESELAWIDWAALEIELASGERRMIASKLPKLATRDFSYLNLSFGDEVELGFALPAGIEQRNVVRSALHVTGYYERYGHIRNGLQRISKVRGAFTPSCPVPSFAVTRAGRPIGADSTLTARPASAAQKLSGAR
jgi:hypothetical protein